MKGLPIAGIITLLVLIGFVLILGTGKTCTLMGCIPVLTIEFAEPHTGLLRIEVADVVIDECEFKQAVELSAAMSAFDGYGTQYVLKYTELDLSYPRSFASGIVISTRDRCSEDARELARFSLPDIERTVMYPNGEGCPGSCDNLRVRVP